MYFRQLLNDESACASYLLGCKTHGKFAVVDPHIDLVDEYVSLADAQGMPIVAVFDTHVQADHVSGLPELVRRTGATAYLPGGAGVGFERRHNPALQLRSEDVFVAALTSDIPPPPEQQAAIIAANRAGQRQPVEVSQSANPNGGSQLR
jgi:glyoxylase-like metal-dependent hydrolase (beta-lactamase superfamily II)